MEAAMVGRSSSRKSGFSLNLGPSVFLIESRTGIWSASALESIACLHWLYSNLVCTSDILAGLANLITAQVNQLIISMFPEVQFSGADSRFPVSNTCIPIHSAKAFEPAAFWNTAYYGVKTCSRLELPLVWILAPIIINLCHHLLRVAMRIKGYKVLRSAPVT